MKLGVNIDHVATLRQARGGKEPDPVFAAKICQKAGAHGIVMHLREDRRHIQEDDLFRVKEAVSIKLNLEMSADLSIVRIAEKLLPDQATLVPERRREMTTEKGLNLFKNPLRLQHSINALKKKNITVSLFIDTDSRQLERAKKLGADAVEFHTGHYAGQRTPRGLRHELERIKKCAVLAEEMHMVAHAGHGLDYQNTAKLKAVSQLEELNIGYSIVTRALWVGLENAVREMLVIIQ